MLITIGYTGMRWGETTGLEHAHLLPTYINVEWQLREIQARFHRLPPKDDSYRSTNYQPLLPVDLPPFLSTLLTAQAARHTQRCACAAQHGGSGRYVFLGPDGGHYRRSNYARRVFRPACDGRYSSANGQPPRLVITLRCPPVSGQGSNRISPERDGGNVGTTEKVQSGIQGTSRQESDR